MGAEDPPLEQRVHPVHSWHGGLGGSGRSRSTVFLRKSSFRGRGLYPRHPSRSTTEPGATTLRTNVTRLVHEASGAWFVRVRPKPLGGLISTAITTKDFAVLRPRLRPCSTPTRVSSTSTSPESGSRSARIMATRNPCRMPYAHPAADPDLGLQRCGRHPVLGRGEVPGPLGPCGEGDAGLVQDGPRRDGGLVPALWAHQSTPGLTPRVDPRAACGTHESIRPPQLLQVPPTGSVVGEPLHDLPVVARVVPSRHQADWFSPGLAVGPYPHILGQQNLTVHPRKLLVGEKR